MHRHWLDQSIIRLTLPSAEEGERSNARRQSQTISGLAALSPPAVQRPERNHHSINQRTPLIVLLVKVKVFRNTPLYIISPSFSYYNNQTTSPSQYSTTPIRSSSTRGIHVPPQRPILPTPDTQPGARALLRPRQTFASLAGSREGFPFETLRMRRDDAC